MANPARTCTAMLLAALAAGSLCQAAGPPELNIPKSALAGKLLPMHVKQITAVVRHYAGELAATRNEHEIRTITARLHKMYRRYESTDYRYEFAKASADVITPLLNRDVPLARAKQVNIAMFFARMRQVSIQPALEVMVSHPNPGVRLHAWRAYRNIRTLLLAQGMGHAAAMFKSLEGRAAAEGSAPVMESVFAMLAFPAKSAGAVPQGALLEARKQSLRILQGIWPEWCRRVRGGSVMTADASRAGIASLYELADAPDGGKTRATAAGQMILDIAWHSAKAYDDAKASGPVAMANALLLRDCESVLNGISKLGKRSIRDPMTNPRETDPGSAVRLGVLKWVKALKGEGYKVREPKIVAGPKASTQPTTGKAPPVG